MESSAIFRMDAGCRYRHCSMALTSGVPYLDAQLLGSLIWMPRVLAIFLVSVLVSHVYLGPLCLRNLYLAEKYSYYTPPN